LRAWPAPPCAVSSAAQPAGELERHGPSAGRVTYRLRRGDGVRLFCAESCAAAALSACRAGAGAGHAVRERAAVCVHRVAARAVRPLRRLHPGGQGAGVLPAQAAEEEGQVGRARRARRSASRARVPRGRRGRAWAAPAQGCCGRTCGGQVHLHGRLRAPQAHCVLLQAGSKQAGGIISRRRDATKRRAADAVKQQTKRDARQALCCPAAHGRLSTARLT